MVLLDHRTTQLLDMHTCMIVGCAHHHRMEALTVWPVWLLPSGSRGSTTWKCKHYTYFGVVLWWFGHRSDEEEVVSTYSSRYQSKIDSLSTLKEFQIPPFLVPDL